MGVVKRLLGRDALTWALRGLWIVLPFAVPTRNVDESYENPWVILTVFVAIWFVGLIASFTPFPVTLAAIRAIMPASIPVAIWRLTQTDSTALGATGVVIALIVSALALSATIGDRFADGASYGNERRMLLRPPTGVLFGPLPLAWIATVAGATAGIILLGDERWLTGIIATVAGLPLAYLGFRSLHSLTRRWVVFVPTGLVIHDPVALVDPVLFPRDAVRFVGPALADTTATDVSSGASGLLLELNLITNTQVPVRDKTGPKAVVSAPVETDALLFAPTLPGEALAEAERRKLPVH